MGYRATFCHLFAFKIPLPPIDTIRYPARMKRFTTEPLVDIFEWIQQQQQDAPAGHETRIEIVAPSLAPCQMEGELVVGPQGAYRARSLRGLVDLAEALGCGLLTPEPGVDNFVRLTFQKLDRTRSWHDSAQSGPETILKQTVIPDLTDLYGSDSERRGTQYSRETCLRS